MITQDLLTVSFNSNTGFLIDSPQPQAGAQKKTRAEAQREWGMGGSGSDKDCSGSGSTNSLPFMEFSQHATVPL